MEIWQAIILGLVEGITEYLPISSTGHLILASALMGLDEPDHKAAVDAFTIVIQGGAILAVLGLYWPRVRSMIAGLLGRDAAGFRLLLNLIVAFIPAAIFGKLLDDWIESKLFHTGPVIAALVVGGVFMMLVDQWRAGRFGIPLALRRPKSIEELTFIDCLKIGLLQCIAMWPGTSRSMMTITGGLFVGLKPREAAEFSFLLGVPTLGAATLYKLYKNLSIAHETHTPNLFEQLGMMSCIIGIAAAAVSAAFAVKWLVGFLNKHGLTAFGWYRLALAAVLLTLIGAGVVRIGNHGPAGGMSGAAESTPSGSR
ncbi:MAG: undecaprenyl-diphosphate phosphatase [Phycisphaerales bacterium]|nr:undecaprenyl-diphosphate phosphatase [Phycisphaerales bacterium]